MRNNASGPDLTADSVEEGIIRKVMQALHDAGIYPTDDLIADGELHRVHCEDDSPGSQDGWYVIHMDGPVPHGFFGHWREGRTHVWTAKRTSELSPEDRAALEQHQAEVTRRQQEERAEARARCRATAQRIWSMSQSVESHPYLIRKGIKAHGVRAYKGSLVVPLTSSSQDLVGLQLISANGEKHFLPGTAKSGAFYKIEGNPAKLAVCEGFATGASIREATGFSVAVAFDAGNLLKVASALRASLPAEVEIIVCADNDVGKELNTGLTKGREAAEAIGAKLAYPTFQDERQGTDFNDLHQLVGSDAVKAAVEAAEPAIRLNTIELPKPTFENRTEITNSIYLAHAVLEQAAFVAEDERWAQCRDDGFWEFDANHRVENAGKEIHKIWLQASRQASDPEIASALLSFSRQSASASGIKAMMKLASSLPHLRLSRTQFDDNPTVIGVANGVLNLDELCFRQAKPSDYVTRRLGTAYIHNATCTKWEAFLMESVGGETPEEKALMVQFLQIMVAAALLGVKGLRKIFHIYGPPGSGKSLFVNTLHNLFGEYARSLSPNAITNPRFRDNDVKMPEIAGLAGIRLAAVYEAGEGFCFNDELLKALSGGDLITARVLNKNPIEFAFGGVLLSVGNGWPSSSTSASRAFMERLQLIAFPNAVPVERRNLNLEAELKEELPGILNWAARGVELYRQIGFVTPIPVVRDVNAYRESLDAIQCFISECCDTGVTYWESTSNLYQSYRQWATDNGFPIYGQRVFSLKLTEKGHRRARKHNVRGHEGLRERHHGIGQAPLPEVNYTP